MNRSNCIDNYGKQSNSDLIPGIENGEDQQVNLLETEMGIGNIRFIRIEPGLQLRLWDCLFTNGHGILRHANYEITSGRNFTLIYFMTPESVALEECQQSSAVINEVWNIAWMSSDAIFRAQLLPAKPFRCISISFSAEWWQKNVLADIALNKPGLVSPEPFVFFESQSAVERRVNESLLEHADKKEFGKFFWRSGVLNLVTAFFMRMAESSSWESHANYPQSEKIAAIQQKLLESIYNGLPDIRTMARQVSVSESKLKRHFRKVYGENIYSYYQEKRMLCAKRLLTEKNKTVTETASIMGYGSVSSFNNTFKRFFGLKPDQFQQINMVAVEI